MLIEQIIEVKPRVPGLLVAHFPKSGLFSWQNKNLWRWNKNLRVNDLMLKILQKAIYLDFPDQAKSQNLTPKWKILNVFWTWLGVKSSFIRFDLSFIKKSSFIRFHAMPCRQHKSNKIAYKVKGDICWITLQIPKFCSFEVKGEICWITLQIPKFCSFKWLSKRAKCDPNGIKIAFFSQKLTTNRLAAGCFALRLL